MAVRAGIAAAVGHGADRGAVHASPVGQKDYSRDGDGDAQEEEAQLRDVHRGVLAVENHARSHRQNDPERLRY